MDKKVSFKKLILISGFSFGIVAIVGLIYLFIKFFHIGETFTSTGELTLFDTIFLSFLFAIVYGFVIIIAKIVEMFGTPKN